jgi:hypothetical protein
MRDLWRGRRLDRFALVAFETLWRFGLLDDDRSGWSVWRKHRFGVDQLFRLED